MRINGKQEQILFYLYELRNTPERGVGPDPRLTTQGITEGTQIPIGNIMPLLQGLVDNAFVRPLLIGGRTFHYLTQKGTNQVEKVQENSFSVGIDRSGLGLGFRKSETRGARYTPSRGETS
jgi:hypothetical protein